MSIKKIYDCKCEDCNNIWTKSYTDESFEFGINCINLFCYSENVNMTFTGLYENSKHEIVFENE